MKITKEEVLKEALEHKGLVKKYGIAIAVQIVKDHKKRPKTTTRQGKNQYQKMLMRRNRLVAGMDMNKKNMSKEDFGIVWEAIFGEKNKRPKVEYKKW